MAHLFRDELIVSHSGLALPWWIDCDALTDADLATLAKVAAIRIPPFREVAGIPRGGLRFAEAMRPHCTEGPRLLVDDVLTTGNSMEAARQEGDSGLVIFARGPCPTWVRTLFTVDL